MSLLRLMDILLGMVLVLEGLFRKGFTLWLFTRYNLSGEDPAVPRWFAAPVFVALGLFCLYRGLSGW